VRPAKTLAGAADTDADCGFEVGVSDTARGGMYWNQAQARLGFGLSRLADVYPLEIDATGNVTFAGNGAADNSVEIGGTGAGGNSTLLLNASTATRNATIDFALADTVTWRLDCDGNATGDSLTLTDAVNDNVLMNCVTTESAPIFPGGIASAQVSWSTKLTAGQTLTYSNAVVANPRAGWFRLTNGMAQDSVVTIRGVALRSADQGDHVNLHWGDANYAHPFAGTLIAHDMTANADNALAGFSVAVRGSAISALANLDVWWEIVRSGVTDQLGHTVT
jgi:hypothetical protein